MRGMSRRFPSEWQAWKHLLKRCHDPRDKDFKNYGGRGIKVCPEWINNFPQFLVDVGPKPCRERLTWLGRLDVNRGYEPGNCAWVKHQRQISKRRYCHQVKLDEQEATIQETARNIGIPPMTMRKRLLVMGLWPEKAATVGRLPYRRDSHHYTLNGQTMSLPEWARLLGVRLRTLRERLRRGVPLERALMPGDHRKFRK